MTKDRETFLDRVRAREAAAAHAAEEERPKTLRERVAERQQAGPDEEEKQAKKRRKRVAHAGNTLQIIGLGLLIFELWPMLSGEFTETNLPLVIIFAAVFMTGRVLVAGADIFRFMSRR